MPTVITRESPAVPAVAALVEELEAHLATRYPRESRHGLSVQRLIDEEVDFFVTRIDGDPVGCGGIQFFPEGYGELKRMYVRPSHRGRGLGRLMLDRLSAHALDVGVSLLRLETGTFQEEAISMYESAGFRRIPPFGSYTDDP